MVGATKGRKQAHSRSVLLSAGLGLTMLSLNILPVLYVGLLGQGEAVCLQPSDAELHSVLRHHFRCLASYVLDESVR